MKNLFSFKNHVKSISLVIVLILFYSAITQAQSSNQFFNQNQFDPRTDFPLVFVNGQAVPRQQTEGPVWENIQSVSIPQQIGPGIFAKPVSIDLDQVRNGSADSRLEPPNWVNGNAGASNAHYVEGYAIPYRLVIENLVGTGLRSVDIEWDTRHSGANAIDFITNFDLIDFPAGSHLFNFAHPQETINPLFPEGFTNITKDGNPTSPNIITPANLNASALTTFNAIQSAGRGKFGIWGAEITPVAGAPLGLKYITENPLTGAQSSTRLRIYFTNTDPTVIISWGGHIARGADWGVGNSASAVSGSPYHTRTIEWDPQGDNDSPESLGNQDRSLSADAVLDPPKCNLTGPSSLECTATSTFYSGVSSSDITSGVTWEWTIVDNNTNATICSSNPPYNVDYLCVNAGRGCNTFTVRYRLLKTQGGTTNEISRCVKIVTVTDAVPPVISGVGGPSTIDCPASPTFSNPTASDACSNSTVSLSHSDASTTSCGSARTVTRTWTAVDACNNSSTASQTITVRDITAPVISGVGGPSTISCPATPTFSNPTASDACGTGTFTPSSTDATTPGTCTNNYSVTRKWTATDVCGNTSTASQTITVTDNTAPIISGVGGPSTISCPATPTFSNPTASDACGIGTFTPSSTDATTPGTCTNRYSVTRKWTATDVCGNTSTASQTITVTDNNPPVITGVGGPSTIDCPATPTFSNPTASDACGTGTFTPSSSDATTPGTCANNYSVTRKWTATDACGNTATASQTITVRDITPPVITCPQDVIVECNAPTSSDAAGVGSATATDACGPTTITASDVPVTRNCVTVITRTWKARDACGNTATCVQHITKRDDTPPVITCNVNGDGGATATDNCSDPITYKVGNVWTAIDGSGNITTASCPVLPGLRITSSPVTAEQKEQTATTVTEEKAKAKTLGKSLVIANDVKVNAVPNPFNDRVKFVVNSPQAGYGTLEVMNMLGQKVKTVYQGHINAGGQSFEMVLSGGRNASLFYILRMNGKVVTGKLVQAGVINK